MYLIKLLNLHIGSEGKANSYSSMIYGRIVKILSEKQVKVLTKIPFSPISLRLFRHHVGSLNIRFSLVAFFKS